MASQHAAQPAAGARRAPAGIANSRPAAAAAKAKKTVRFGETDFFLLPPNADDSGEEEAMVPEARRPCLDEAYAASLRVAREWEAASAEAAKRAAQANAVPWREPVETPANPEDPFNLGGGQAFIPCGRPHTVRRTIALDTRTGGISYIPPVAPNMVGPGVARAPATTAAKNLCWREDDDDNDKEPWSRPDFPPPPPNAMTHNGVFYRRKAPLAGHNDHWTLHGHQLSAEDEEWDMIEIPRPVTVAGQPRVPEGARLFLGKKAYLLYGHVQDPSPVEDLARVLKTQDLPQHHPPPPPHCPAAVYGPFHKSAHGPVHVEHGPVLGQVLGDIHSGSPTGEPASPDQGNDAPAEEELVDPVEMVDPEMENLRAARADKAKQMFQAASFSTDSDEAGNEEDDEAVHEVMQRLFGPKFTPKSTETTAKATEPSNKTPETAVTTAKSINNAPETHSAPATGLSDISNQQVTPEDAEARRLRSGIMAMLTTPTRKENIFTGRDQENMSPGPDNSSQACLTEQRATAADSDTEDSSHTRRFTAVEKGKGQAIDGGESFKKQSGSRQNFCKKKVGGQNASGQTVGGQKRVTFAQLPRRLTPIAASMSSSMSSRRGAKLSAGIPRPCIRLPRVRLPGGLKPRPARGLSGTISAMAIRDKTPEHKAPAVTVSAASSIKDEPTCRCPCTEGPPPQNPNLPNLAMRALARYRSIEITERIALYGRIDGISRQFRQQLAEHIFWSLPMDLHYAVANAEMDASARQSKVWKAGCGVPFDVVMFLAEVGTWVWKYIIPEIKTMVPLLDRRGWPAFVITLSLAIIISPNTFPYPILAELQLGPDMDGAVVGNFITTWSQQLTLSDDAAQITFVSLESLQYLKRTKHHPIRHIYRNVGPLIKRMANFLCQLREPEIDMWRELYYRTQWYPGMPTWWCD